MYSFLLIVAFVAALIAAAYTVFKFVFLIIKSISLGIKRIIATLRCSIGTHDYRLDEYKLRLKSEVNLACKHCGDHRFERYVEDWEYEQ